MTNRRQEKSQFKLDRQIRVSSQFSLELATCSRPEGEVTVQIVATTVALEAATSRGLAVRIGKVAKIHSAQETQAL